MSTENAERPVSAAEFARTFMVNVRRAWGGDVPANAGAARKVLNCYRITRTDDGTAPAAGELAAAWETALDMACKQGVEHVHTAAAMELLRSYRVCSGLGGTDPLAETAGPAPNLGEAICRHFGDYTIPFSVRTQMLRSLTAIYQQWRQYAPEEETPAAGPEDPTTARKEEQ